MRTYHKRSCYYTNVILIDKWIQKMTHARALGHTHTRYSGNPLLYALRSDLKKKMFL